MTMIEILNVWDRRGRHLASFIHYQRLGLRLKVFYSGDDILDAAVISEQEWQRLIEVYKQHIIKGNLQRLTLTGNMLIEKTQDETEEKIRQLLKDGRLLL